MAELKAERPVLMDRTVSIGQVKDALHVLVPPDLTVKEVRVVFDGIVAEIERLTGHPCMSGTHDVILRNR